MKIQKQSKEKLIAIFQAFSSVFFLVHFSKHSVICN